MIEVPAPYIMQFHWHVASMLLQVSNHTGQIQEKTLLGPAGIRTHDLWFTSTVQCSTIELQDQSSWEQVVER